MSVDGDTSTNDTMLVLANGAGGVQPDEKDRKKVGEALTEVMEDLARQIARDGEGARKLVTIEVSGAAGDDAAERIARTIANSPLVKTAIAGSDPNWGRILIGRWKRGRAVRSIQGRHRSARSAGVPRRAGCRFFRARVEEEAGRRPSA